MFWGRQEGRQGGILLLRALRDNDGEMKWKIGGYFSLDAIQAGVVVAEAHLSLDLYNLTIMRLLCGPKGGNNLAPVVNLSFGVGY